MKRLLHLINEVSLGWMFAGLSAIVVGFAFGYWILAAEGQLVFTWTTAMTPNFWDSLYFSIVTISSLGYGDIRPMGFARALVGAEVILGLAFLGLMVAKVSSVKQDYILRRMYSDLVDDKLAKFARDLEEQRTLYRTTSQLLLSGDIDPDLTMTFRRNTPGSTFFSSFRQLLADVTALMTEEARNGALFGAVDDSRIEAVYDAVRGVLLRTMMMWQRDSTAACDFVLCDNGPDIEQICANATVLADLGRQHSRNGDILKQCDAITDLCGQIHNEVLPKI